MASGKEPLKAQGSRELRVSLECPEDGKPKPGEKSDATAATERDPSGSGDSNILPENITGQRKIKLWHYDEEVWGTERDLDENAYGCAAVSLVRETTTLAIEREKGGMNYLTIVRLTVSMSLMVLNLALQFTILNYISSYVVEPAVRNVQLSYQHFHATMFNDDGSLKPDAWDEYLYKDDICQITMADPWFYYLIVLLWTLRILDELRHIHRFIDEVTSIPGCTLARHMVEFVDTDTNDALLGGRCLITHLTTPMRWLLLTVVSAPRAFIACYLLVLGCRWLSASANFADMVLNALALIFVTDIDELLYESLLPVALKKQIADTDWFFIEEPKTKKEVEKTEWMLYRRTFIWMAVTVIFLVVYGMFFQTVLPFGVSDISAHCAAHLSMTETPICTAWSWSGWSEGCYPFGEGEGR